MNKSKTNIWWFFIVVIIAGWGCGASPKTRETVKKPFWINGGTAAVLEHYPDSDYITAHGAAEGGKMDQNAKQKAELQALNEINRHMEVELTNVVRNVDKAVDTYTEKKSQTNLRSEFLSNTVAFSKGSLSGVTYKYWYDEHNGRHHVLAVLARSRNYQAILQKGISALVSGSTDTAIQCFTIAKASKPLKAEPYFRLASAFERKGMSDRAVAMYEDIAATTSQDRWKKSAKSRLMLIKNRRAEGLLSKAQTYELDKGAKIYKQALFSADGQQKRNKIAVEYQNFIIKKTAEKIIKAAEEQQLNKVAVFKIKDEFGESSSSGSAVADKLTTELASYASERVSVIERSRIMDVIDETELTDVMTVQEIGERFGVDGMIVGTVGSRVNIRLLKKSDASIVTAVSKDWFGPEKGLQEMFNKTAAEEMPEEEIKLRIAMFGQRSIGGNWVDVDVNDGSVMSSGDLFKIHMSVNEDAYVYVLYYSSQGEASLLFPRSRVFLASKVKADKEITIPPGPDQWYWLDEVTGKETFYFIASLTPLTDIEELLPQMEKAGGAGKITRAIRTRGIGGVTKGKKVSVKAKHSGDVTKVSEIVTGSGDVVRIITIHHK